MKMKFKNNISAFRRYPAGQLLCTLYIVFSFCVPDLWLRVVTRWIGAYSIYALAPNLFTLLWACVLTAFVTMFPSRRTGKIVYSVLYAIFMIYAAVQYGGYLILGKFLYVSDFLLAGEGADYASWVVDVLTPEYLLQILMLAMVGSLGIAVFPEQHAPRRTAFAVRIAAIMLCLVCMLPIPRLLYKDTSAEGNVFQNPALEYERFINPNFDVELTGMYQFLVRDIQVRVKKATKDYSAEIAMIDAFFDRRAPHEENALTGVFEGKNVIVVMMESLDDWLITPEDTPTIHRMMSESISFTHMYTPSYSGGYTFNTEFAFNTAVYPYTNGNAAYTLQRNHFDCSIANRFSDAGYVVRSFHEGKSDYYNRGQMHVSLGYERYYSYQDYPEEAVSVYDDRFLVESDGIYNQLVGDQPFCSFVITYSPHLPYTAEEEYAQNALALYPQYLEETDREVGILRAKTRLTDEMFAGLLDRLEADGLLEDTVIVGFADHYTYGLADQELLRRYSMEAGSPILERTPAFIYCAGSNLSMEMDKVMQTTDLAPTIMNLFGLEVPKCVMGQDVFDANYEGYAIFTGGTWVTNTTYVKAGQVIWNNGMSDAQIAAMNAYVQQVYQINDAILDSDYYQNR